jgi:excisionase family DNA binding protein
MLTKKEAAVSLGVSERAIERYTKAGRLTPTYQQSKSGGTLALFAERDLDRLKEEMAAPKERATAGAIAGREPTRADIARRDGASGLVEALREAVSAPRVSLSDKLLLSIDEAAALSGLSAHHIREAIHGKKLKARIIGKGWRIKADELRAYVRKL